VPQRGRLVIPVKLDRPRGKGDKAVVAEPVVAESVVAEAAVAEPVVAAIESKE
jgi:hypothetical protein